MEQFVLARPAPGARPAATPVRAVPTQRIVALGLAGAFLAAVLIGVLAYGAGRLGPASVGAYTTTYDHRVLDDPLELLLVQSDGQAFASLARDPSLARPEVFRSDGEAAYRAQRPLLPYLAWGLSLGRTGWVPPALAILAAAGAGVAVAGIAQLLADRRAPPGLALLVLLFPGTFMALSYCGPEPLGLGLVAWGLVRWRRERVVSAIALFAVAGLCRETLLLVPAGLAFGALWQRRVRVAVALSSSAGGYLAWITFVRLRVGAWPTAAGQGRIGAPFAGLVAGLRDAAAGRSSDTILYALLCLAMGVVAVVMARRDALLPVVVAHVAFATTMGRYVWQTWEGFGRVLLPLNALALVMICGTVLADRARTELSSPARSRP